MNGNLSDFSKRVKDLSDKTIDKYRSEIDSVLGKAWRKGNGEIKIKENEKNKGDER